MGQGASTQNAVPPAVRLKAHALSPPPQPEAVTAESLRRVLRAVLTPPAGVLIPVLVEIVAQYAALIPLTVHTLCGDDARGLVNGCGSDARFNCPRGVTTYWPGGKVGAGEAILLVADRFNSIIRCIDLTTNTVSSWDGGVCAITHPHSIAVDTRDNSLLVATDFSVRRIRLSSRSAASIGGEAGPVPVVSFVAGSEKETWAFQSVDGCGRDARFQHCSSIVWATRGNAGFALVTDFNSHRIRRIDFPPLQSRETQAEPQTEPQAEADLVTVSSVAGTGHRGELELPSDLSWDGDSAESVVFVTTRQDIKRFDLTTKTLTLLCRIPETPGSAGPHLSQVFSLIWLPAPVRRRLIACTTSCVFVVDADTGQYVTTIAGKQSMCAYNDSPDPSIARFDWLMAAAFLPARVTRDGTIDEFGDRLFALEGTASVPFAVQSDKLCTLSPLDSSFSKIK